MQIKSDSYATSITAPLSAVPARKLTSARLLAGNVIWNIIGTCAPMLIAIVCLPVLKRTLGTERLGVISLAWVIVGYFSMFDFGLSRALTKLVAEKLGQKQLTEIPDLVWTSIMLLIGVGLSCAIVTWLLNPWIVERLVKVPVPLQRETINAFYWLSISIPFVVITAALRGVLEALQRFRLATWIRIPMGVFSYAGPVAILPFTHNLAAIMALLVLGRIAACVAHLWACFYALPALKDRRSFHKSSLVSLLRFGTWMTVSNVIGPFMMTFDRFVIAALISISAVAYYAVPYEAVSKVTLFPAALIAVMFPAFSTAGAQDRDRLVLLCDAATRYLFITMFPITLLIIGFAPDGLRLWLGSDFAANSTPVVRWLALAIFVNSLAQVPYAHIQGDGRPDITAKLHILELPVYALLLFSLAHTMGIRGVAVAWTLRVVLDAGLLFGFSHRLLPQNKLIFPRLPLMLTAALAAFLLATISAPMVARVALISALAALGMVSSWRGLLSEHEKASLQRQLRRGPSEA